MNKNSPIYVFVFIVVLSAVFGAGVATVHITTQSLLERNERLHRNRAIARAFMLDVPRTTPQAFERAISRALDTMQIEGERGRITMLKHAHSGRLGFIFSGMGFWDVIRGVIVLSPDLEKVANIRFLEQKETPGLGARIEEEWFVNQFRRLEIAWEAPPDERIVIGGGARDGANRVDAITGATQTSMALMRILNQELAAFKQAYDTRSNIKHHDPERQS